MSQTPSALERYRSLVNDWASFEEAAKTPLPTTFWVNPLRATCAQVIEELQALGLAPQPVPWAHPLAFRLPPDTVISRYLPYLTGAYHQQEEAALLPVRLLAPQPGERVLDMCAAPGGKTLQMAVAMANRGTVVANDISRNRIRAIRGHLDRLGLINTVVTLCNASNLPPEIGCFDRIMADVPCSCLGTSRKTLAAERWELQTSLDLVGLQASILRRAVQLCRRGGRILYATCTYAPEENEAVVDTILREFGDTLRLCPIEDQGLQLTAGLSQWEGRSYHPDLALSRRLWPHHSNTGGFYVALLERLDGPTTYGVPATNLSDDGVAAPLLDCQERFGLPDDLRTRYGFYRANGKYIHIHAPDLLPPPHPEPESIGLRFLRVRGDYPKLTTEAARLLAPLASRNRLFLTADQAQTAIEREFFTLHPDQAAACPEPGYVMLMHGPHLLGLGVRRSHNELESMVPKRLHAAGIDLTRSGADPGTEMGHE